MRIAVIRDIHSNHYALREVLADIDNRSIDTIICTGDLVGYLPFPNEVIDIIREHKILTIKGNHDAYISNLKRPTTQEIGELAASLYDTDGMWRFENFYDYLYLNGKYASQLISSTLQSSTP